MSSNKKTEIEESEPRESLLNPKTSELSDEMVQIKQREKHEPLTDKYVQDLLSSTKTRWNHFISKRKVIIITALALISWIVALGLVTLLLTDF
ncbi:MAG: hypothetical protein ACYCZO_12110 [Daejeonella sp.]